MTLRSKIRQFRSNLNLRSNLNKKYTVKFSTLVKICIKPQRFNSIQ